MIRHSVALLITVTALAAGCSSCFTGIESTPRITRDDVRRSGVKTTQEQAFADQIAGEAPRDWKPGKMWQVTDNKISLIFAGSPTEASDLAGRQIVLDRITPVNTVTGINNVELTFKDAAGKTFAYMTDVAIDDWATRQNVAVPFTVEMSVVNRADSLLRGKTLYITTPLWYDRDGRMINGLRHIPVTVNRVLPGNENYPLCVAFTPSVGNGVECYIFMTYGKSASSTRNFERLFAFDNPRLRYPQITDDKWALIVRSRVAEGMSRDEAKLALGTPASIDKGYTQGSLQMERWSYGDGVYLIFEEGTLIRYRI